jgi:hypothetical protein
LPPSTVGQATGAGESARATIYAGGRNCENQVALRTHACRVDTRVRRLALPPHWFLLCCPVLHHLSFFDRCEVFGAGFPEGAEKVREKHFEPPINADETILFNPCLSVFIGGL